MDDLAALVERLRSAPHGELREIERETGVPYSTIRRIKDGVILNPGVLTFDKIRGFYAGRPAQIDGADAAGQAA